MALVGRFKINNFIYGKLLTKTIAHHRIMNRREVATASFSDTKQSVILYGGKSPHILDSYTKTIAFYYELTYNN